jgi:hypothetical protein
MSPITGTTPAQLSSIWFHAMRTTTRRGRLNLGAGARREAGPRGGRAAGRRDQVPAAGSSAQGMKGAGRALGRRSPWRQQLPRTSTPGS